MTAAYDKIRDGKHKVREIVNAQISAGTSSSLTSDLNSSLSQDQNGGKGNQPVINSHKSWFEAKANHESQAHCHYSQER